MSKAKAPEWMVEAAWSKVKGFYPGSPIPEWFRYQCDAICQAIQDSPRELSRDEMRGIRAGCPYDKATVDAWAWAFSEFQRSYMFRAEPDVPEEIKDLLEDAKRYPNHEIQGIILEAYKRGKASK